MKRYKFLSLVMVVIFLASCTKHEISYMSVPDTGNAEFQLHYVVPITSSSTFNIIGVTINDQIIANSKAPLQTYNAIPSGAAGRFYSSTPGSNTIKMFMKGKSADSLVYNQSVTLTAKKQNIFVYDFNKAPVIFDNGYPYIGNVTQKTDSVAWIKFYNFLYETVALGTTTLKLQYQYIDYRTNQPVNIGKPVAFGEATDWSPVIVVKDNLISQGSRTMTYKIKTVDANGNIVGDLQVLSGSSTIAYTATLSTGIARRYHQILAGYRNAAPNSSVRTFTAL
jgi:hypothetical protein